MHLFIFQTLDSGMLLKAYDETSDVDRQTSGEKLGVTRGL